MAVDPSGKDSVQLIEALLQEFGISLEKGKGLQPFKVEGKGGDGKPLGIPLANMSTKQACEWLATRTGVSG